MNKLVFLFLTAIVCFFSQMQFGDFAIARPLRPAALVYRGPGACPEGCSAAAADVAWLAGYFVTYVGPNSNPEGLFNNAKVWIQPGGVSKDVATAMTPELRARLIQFVREGGAYVGFCAGGFLATEQIGDTGVPGLGLVPGRSHLYRNVDDHAAILPYVLSPTYTRYMYWEGGPWFDLQGIGVPGGEQTIQIKGSYGTGEIATLYVPFGNGRVAVTGFHPEAPRRWVNYFGLYDPDGMDTEIAVAMVRWATSKESLAGPSF